MTKLLTFAVQGVQETPAVDAAARTVAGLVVPFDVAVGRGFFTAIFRKDTTKVPDRLDTVKLLTEHDPTNPVGYATDADYRADGLYMTFSVPAGHPRADAYLADLDANLRDGFSVGLELDDADSMWDAMLENPDEPVEMAGIVREVSAVSVPAFNDARADHGARQLVTFSAVHPPATVKEKPMPTVEELHPQAPPAPAPNPAAMSMAELASQLEPFFGRRVDAHPLARFASYGDYVHAFIHARSEEERTALATAFAMVDQVTSNNPGVIPPGWRTDVKMNLDRRRPAIELFGAIALPDAGMDSNWPYFDGDLDAIIAQQAAQKTALNSVRIDIKKAAAAIHTAGVVSDISYQLLLRSTPSYLDAYTQICEAAWARYTEAKFENDLLTGATGTGTAVDGNDKTGNALFAAIWAAASDAEDADGSPAGFVLVSKDIWRSLGSLTAFRTPSYGTQNLAGTVDASNQTANVNGVLIRKAPFFPTATWLASNSSAAKFAEDGPRQVSAEDVEKLGRDVATWGMYEDAEIYFPKALVKGTVTAATKTTAAPPGSDLDDDISDDLDDDVSGNDLPPRPPAARTAKKTT